MKRCYKTIKTFPHSRKRYKIIKTKSYLCSRLISLVNDLKVSEMKLLFITHKRVWNINVKYFYHNLPHLNDEGKNIWLGALIYPGNPFEFVKSLRGKFLTQVRWLCVLLRKSSIDEMWSRNPMGTLPVPMPIRSCFDKTSIQKLRIRGKQLQLKSMRSFSKCIFCIAVSGLITLTTSWTSTRAAWSTTTRST